MKCFVALLFLVAVAVGDRCTPPEKYSATYFGWAAFDEGSHHVVRGKLVVDMAGRRAWVSVDQTSDTEGKKGEVLFLYNENKTYITSNGHCAEMDIPDIYWTYILRQLNSQLPEDVKLLESGNIADSNLRANLYGGVVEKEDDQVTYVLSQADESCVLVSATYMTAKVATVKFNLFDVKMEIDEEKFVPPKDCTKPSPQAAAGAPSFKLFRCMKAMKLC